MGAALSSNRHHRPEYLTDTAILVQSDGNTFPSAECEEIALHLNSGDLPLPGLKFGPDTTQNLDSPSDCTTLSTISSVAATPLDEKHRYHLVFAYNNKDKEWVQQIVDKLEAEPHNFRCCYAQRDFDGNVTYVQNILCSIMLSQRVIVVLSPDFINESWGEVEDSIAHLTSLSQRRQRVIPVILEECEIPESLKSIQPLEVGQESFWENLFQSLHIDGLPYSDSVHTLRSLTSQSSGYANGQVLMTTHAGIEGFCRARLEFHYDELPTPSPSSDLCMAPDEFTDLIKAVGREDLGLRLSWLFSALPTILLGIVFILWCVAFILVIILFPDNSTSTLPVRLCVFALPAIFIVIGCMFRWRRLLYHRQKFSMCMFSRSVQLNMLLYEKSKPVIISTARTRDETFHIYFMYFNRADCIERIKLLLTHCTDEDLKKLSKLIEIYTLHSGYLEGKPMAVRLAIMMSAAYSINLIFKRIPHSLEQRHTRRRQCLCQFMEEFLAVYLPCIRQEADMNNLKYVFFKYLNCQFKPDALILHALGISLADT